MKTVRFIANFLYYLSLTGAFLFLVTTVYALIVIMLAEYSSTSLMSITGGRFEIFYPFTHKAFLLGDYSASFLVTNFFTIGFYGIFLLLLSKVFHAFRQSKLFTQKNVRRLSVFYLANLLTPVLFGALLLVFNGETGDIIRIIFLHLLIGVFAFFMAAIFRQGFLLQEEQDLTF